MTSSVGPLVFSLLLAVSHALALNQTRRVSDTTFSMDASWTARFSDEDGGYSEDRHYEVMGATCRNDYCDNLQLFQGCSGVRPTLPGSEEWTGWFSEESKEKTCSSGYIMTRMQCRKDNCDEKRLRCEKVDTSKFNLGTPVWELSQFSDNHGSAAPDYMCSMQYGVVTGWACYGSKCDNQKLQCAPLTPSSWTMAAATFGWTGYFGSSQVYSPASHFPITAVSCQGDHCKKLDLYQGTSGTDIETGTLSYWTKQFSDENGGTMRCEANYVVTRIECSGDDCDNKRLQCTMINAAKNMMMNSEWTSEAFSEEGPSHMGQCRPDGYFLTGLHCQGGKCDNVKVICRRVVKKTNMGPAADHAPVGMWEDRGMYFKSMPARTSTLKVCTQDSKGKQASRSQTHSFANQVRTSLEIKQTVGSTLGLAATETETTFGIAYTATTKTANMVSDKISSSSMMSECRTETISCGATCWAAMESIQPGAASATLWQWVVVQQSNDPMRNLDTFVFVPEGHTPFCPPRMQQIGDMTMTNCQDGTFVMNTGRRLSGSPQWV